MISPRSGILWDSRRSGSFQGDATERQRNPGPSKEVCDETTHCRFVHHFGAVNDVPGSRSGNVTGDYWILRWASDGDGVRFQDVVFQVIQFDAALYNNYSVENLFRDPYTIRLDEADYTNILGGVGVFGSLAVDSTVRALPEQISRPGPK